MTGPSQGLPVRVLHLRDSPWVDGPGRTIVETATRIDRSRVDYHVGAFVSDSAAPHPLVEALRARQLPVHPIEDRGGVGREMVERLLALIDSLGTEVLHTSEFRSNVLALLCRRRRPALRLVSTAHGWIANDLKGRAYTLIDRVLLRRFDQVILVSHAMRRRLPAWWVPESRIVVLHNALMTDSYGRSTAGTPRRLAGQRDEIRILNVGRLSPEKGQELANAVTERRDRTRRDQPAGPAVLDDLAGSTDIGRNDRHTEVGDFQHDVRQTFREAALDDEVDVAI